MRFPLPCLLLLAAACGSSAPARKKPAPFLADQVIRVVHNQYRGPNTVFVIENLSGRDPVALRSRPLRAGEPAVAYVPDDVMAEMLKEFDKGDFYDYARPRPANPPGLGASGEVTVTDANGRRLALLRIKAPPGMTPTKEQVDAAKSYGYCSRTFLAVWNAYPPQMQATTSKDAFDANRAAR
ncbi:MAG: hypothetical protein L6Q95_11360 [Planctomycetes bacterium]|nr:hypothetical protein [Planctomycetota bacterium]